MEHYFSEEPQSEHKIRIIKARFQGIDFRFKTDSSIFSPKEIDFGTRFLIETVVKLEQDKKEGRLLDLGCGYGPVGIAWKRIKPAFEVVMSDVNSRAVALARENATLNYVRYVTITQSDGLENIEESFDLILINPPIRAGKATVYRLFEQSFSALNNKGSIYIVIRKQQGAPSAKKKMIELAGNCEIMARSAGYWILQVKKLT